MPRLTRPDGAAIHYEVHGSGHPLLILAPGLAWTRQPWPTAAIDPMRQLGGDFMLIVVDPRHCGASTAPLAPFSYQENAEDHLAVLDALGVSDVQLLGQGIGASRAWALLRQDPDRIAAAVILRPQGVCRPVSKHADFLNLFDETMRVARDQGIAGVIAAARRGLSFAERPAGGPFANRIRVDQDAVSQLLHMPVEIYNAMMVRYRDGLWPAGRPLFSVTDEWLASCPVPQLVEPGHDPLHSTALVDHILDIAPQAARLPVGKAGVSVDVDLVRDFLTSHARTGQAAQGRA
jgi:pimeloyl-ACP methyl ester carboxylesterase